MSFLMKPNGPIWHLDFFAAFLVSIRTKFEAKYDLSLKLLYLHCFRIFLEEKLKMKK